MPPHVTAADHEDISRFGRCALEFESLLDLGDRDFVVTDGRRRFSVGVFVLVPTELHTPG